MTKEEFIAKDNSTVERRYTPPTNIVAKERLDSFRKGVKEFQAKHPEVLGATIYGSMIKGEQAHSESDVDGFLYIDGEKMTGQKMEVSEYKKELLDSMKVNESDREGLFQHMRPKILTREIVDQEIHAQLEFYKEHAQFKKMLEEKSREENYYDTPEEERMQLILKEPFRSLDFGIKGLFHPRIGTGIEKYRKVFLEKLAEMPDKESAEKLWDDVAFNLKNFEQRSDPTVVIEIPSTLESALKIYHKEYFLKIKREEEKEQIRILHKELKSQL